MAGGRTDRGLYDGRNVSGVGMCLEVGEIGDCMVDAMYKEQGCGWIRKDRGLYDGRNVKRARMWLEVGETEDCMIDAMYQESGCGWR